MVSRAKSLGLLLLGAMVVTLAACQRPATEAGAAGDRGAGGTAGGGDAIRFWHTQTQENETALEQIVSDFNTAQPGTPIEATYIGDYNALYEKIRGLAAGGPGAALPDLAVAYESMIADYMEADIVRPLDDLLADSELGLGAEELADIFPAYLETNRFPQFNDQLLSFPFTKSNLMLYYNEAMLTEVGVGPPGTWDEFLAACRAIKARRNIVPLASAIDPSTVDGIVMSMGGELISEDGRNALFETAAAKSALELLDTLYGEGLAYQVVDKGDQNNDFAAQKCAFFFRSSTARPFVQELVGTTFPWNTMGLPAKQGLTPLTVMFGGNICIFRTNDARERRAWEFIKYFVSPEVTAEWATATGYLPVRKSAAETEVMRAFFAAAPQNKAAFDLISVARPEPNVAGWQVVRNCLETAETAIATRVKDVAQVVAELDQCADAALQGTP